MTIKTSLAGRPRVTDPDRIGRAVAELGFQELTFAKVADRLGISVPTLYRYVADHDELVRHGLEHVLRNREWPQPAGPWRTVLQAWGNAAWQAWADYPGAVLEVSAGVAPVAMLEVTTNLVQYLTDAGFSPIDAVLAVDLVLDLAADSRRAVELTPSEAVVGEISELLRSRSADPVVRALGAAAEADPREWFTRKLTVLLDGIEAALAPEPHSQPHEEETDEGR